MNECGGDVVRARHRFFGALQCYAIDRRRRYAMLCCYCYHWNLCNAMLCNATQCNRSIVVDAQIYYCYHWNLGNAMLCNAMQCYAMQSIVVDAMLCCYCYHWNLCNAMQCNSVGRCRDAMLFLQSVVVVDAMPLLDIIGTSAMQFYATQCNVLLCNQSSSAMPSYYCYHWNPCNAMQCNRPSMQCYFCYHWNLCNVMQCYAIVRCRRYLMLFFATIGTYAMKCNAIGRRC